MCQVTVRNQAPVQPPPQMLPGSQPMQAQSLPLSDHCELIRKAAYLNREGSTSMVLGDLRAAVDQLSRALEVIIEAGGFDSLPAIAALYETRSFPFERQAPCSLIAQMRQRQAHKLRNPEDGSFFVYTNPFIFQPIATDVPHYATNCAAVCLFNLALVYHQRGRLADSFAYSRAQTLYSMSLAFVAQMPCQAACANLKIAATNNKAHVQFEISETPEAKTTLQDLLAILMVSKTVNPPPFPEGEIEKFYMNILYMNAATLAGAA